MHFEIKKLESQPKENIYIYYKTFTVLNRENGGYVSVNSWKPSSMKMGNH